MSFISMVSEEQADAELRELYERIKKEFGFLPRLFQSMGSRPDVIHANLETAGAVYGKGVLSKALKEEIGLVVSAVNSSSYCIAAHLEILKSLGVDKQLGRQLIRDFEAANLPENEKALFRFAAKLTREPFKVKQADADELRRHGWDDAVVLETVLVASYFNFINRMSAGLGVIPEHVF